MIYLLEGFWYALQLLFSLAWIVFKYTWPFWAVCFVIGIIKAIISGDSGDDYDYSSSSTPSSKSKYEHEDFWGVHQGSSRVSGGQASHTSWGVPTGSSKLRDDGKVQHYNWYGGYNGTSEIKDGGKRIDHYSETTHVYQGHSEVKDNGDIVHYDWLNREVGRSRKKGD